MPEIAGQLDWIADAQRWIDLTASVCGEAEADDGWQRDTGGIGLACGRWA